MDAETYNLSLLGKSLETWERSPALRTFYQSLFAGISAETIAGPSLEIGAGIAKTKEYIANLTTSDISKTPFVDDAISAYAIDQTDKAWANILAIDVLHHLTHPLAFFASAARALVPGGRIILAEPAATPWGALFYRIFHHEPCLPKQVTPPYEFAVDPMTGEFANMGMGEALFRNQRAHTDQQLNALGLRIQSVHYRDFLAYPLTGGFSRPALAPTFAIRALLKSEQWIPQFVARICGLRMLIVLEKTSAAHS